MKGKPYTKTWCLCEGKIIRAMVLVFLNNYTWLVTSRYRQCTTDLRPLWKSGLTDRCTDIEAFAITLRPAFALPKELPLTDKVEILRSDPAPEHAFILRKWH